MAKVKRRKPSSPTRSTATPAARSGSTGARRKLPIIPILVVGGLGVLIVAIVLSFGSSEDAPAEYGNPQIDGTALTRFSGEAATDDALGSVIPEVQGASFDGTPAAIVNDGTPKILIFLAHWCPVCQDEVPDVVRWLEAGGLPEGLEIISVATGIDRFRDNHPPSEWFARERWTVPVIMDDAANSVAGAFGLNAYPYWVFVDADGNVAGRLTGRLDPAALSSVAATLVP